jgi:hypothetical protein
MMKYAEFECECGAMNCTGDPEFNEPVCFKCGVLGEWFDEVDVAIIQPDDPLPVSVEDAIIQPDEPLPPRLSLMGRYNARLGNK